jgi:hypothetical protein
MASSRNGIPVDPKSRKKALSLVRNMGCFNDFKKLEGNSFNSESSLKSCLMRTSFRKSMGMG